MYKFKQKNESDNQLPFYRFLFLSQTKRKKNRNSTSFLTSIFHYFPKVKQINERGKINFRFIVFHILVQTKPNKQKLQRKSNSVMSVFLLWAWGKWGRVVG